ncbi:MAG: HD-GYP domain-containing protein [Treponema sp.]|jgi:HD-GYP domain-containing protein (c-di-GMP phosphodiesterase class II)|nr:HD-GYP domain-containing protein [Treponema sp.]
MIEESKGQVNNVYNAPPADDGQAAAGMKKYAVKDIPAGNYFTQTVYLDSRFALAAPEMPFSGELAKALSDWGFREVYSDGEPREHYVPDGDPAGNEEIGDPSTIIDPDKIREAEEFYVSFQKYTEILFTRIRVQNGLNFNSMARQIKTVVDFVRENRRFLMRVQRKIDSPDDKSYLASHAVRSTIIAVIIGTYLKLPVHRLIELGTAALLHEVGMLNIPPKVYLSSRALSPQEQKLILGHPVLGFKMLKSLDFPLAVGLPALEHHERENGSGYPQHLSGGKINLYSKIIAVACSYEALSSKRPYKEAKDGYTGMLELLKNEGKQYDDTVVRALVYSLSIYPIGLYVLLSSGKKGQVVDVNPENPRYPVVQIFGELNPDGKNKTLQTFPGGLTIVRPLTRQEIDG